MSHLRQVVLVLLALLTAASTFAAVPDRAWGTAFVGQDAPMWVSEDLSIVEGELQSQHFHPDILTLVESQIEAGKVNSAGCEVFTEPTLGPNDLGRFKGDTSAAIRAATVELITGEITDRKQGFLYGRPGTMLEVSSDGHPKKSSKYRFVYVFLRLADIAVGEARLCSGLKEDRPQPEAGASVVLALEAAIEDGRILGSTQDGYPILQPRPNEILISGALPKAYRGRAVDVEDLRRALRGDGGRQ